MRAVSTLNNDVQTYFAPRLQERAYTLLRINYRILRHCLGCHSDLRNVI
jgi:alpha/beta superfamily hydrolase